MRGDRDARLAYKRFGYFKWHQATGTIASNGLRKSMALRFLPILPSISTYTANSSTEAGGRVSLEIVSEASYFQILQRGCALGAYSLRQDEHFLQRGSIQEESSAGILSPTIFNVLERVCAVLTATILCCSPAWLDSLLAIGTTSSST